MTQKQLAGLLEASALMGKPVFVEEINGAVSALYWA